MFARRSYSLIVFTALMALWFITCGSPNRTTYTQRPDRTAPLDTAGGAGKAKMIYPSRVITANFEVPGIDTCRVKIEVHAVSTKLVRILADSTFDPGKHEIKWLADDMNNRGLDFGIYYYQYEICGKISTLKFTYRPTIF